MKSISLTQSFYILVPIGELFPFIKQKTILERRWFNITMHTV